MNFDSLFDNPSVNPKYTSVKDELIAVSEGMKGMSVFLFPDTSIHIDPSFDEICLMATSLGLGIIIKSKLELVPEHNFGMSYLFIVGKEEAWRVPAYLAVKKVFEHYGWCDGAEYLESYLLGYSERDILDWLNAHQASRIGWTGKTFYLFLSAALASDIDMLGRRSIAPAMIEESVPVFFSRKRRKLLTSANLLIPQGYVLGRASVKEEFFKRIFVAAGTMSNTDVVSSSIEEETIPGLNFALQSNFQFLTEEGWC